MRCSSLLLAAGSLALAACSSTSGGGPTGGGTAAMVGEVATNVLTLQSGTMTELRELRGTGPFRTYDVEPNEMLGVIERAVRKARGLGGLPVKAVFVSERMREVVAKERTPDLAESEFYAPPFRSAVLVTVDPVVGHPARSRVEIHATERGPFHGGVVEWERDLPRWIDEVLAEGEVSESGVRQIP